MAYFCYCPALHTTHTCIHITHLLDGVVLPLCICHLCTKDSCHLLWVFPAPATHPLHCQLPTHGAVHCCKVLANCALYVVCILVGLCGWVGGFGWARLGGWVGVDVCVGVGVGVWIRKVSSKSYKGRGGRGRGGGNRKPSACLMLPGVHEQVL